MSMKISYAIPVCNEYKEIEYLLKYLTKHKKEQDEIADSPVDIDYQMKQEALLEEENSNFLDCC